MIRTVLIFFFLWSSLSIGRSLISLGEIPGRREKGLELDLSAKSHDGVCGQIEIGRRRCCGSLPKGKDYFWPAHHLQITRG
jgi:hypothetical protein